MTVRLELLRLELRHPVLTARLISQTAQLFRMPAPDPSKGVNFLTTTLQAPISPAEVALRRRGAGAGQGRGDGAGGVAARCGPYGQRAGDPRSGRGMETPSGGAVHGAGHGGRRGRGGARGRGRRGVRGPGTDGVRELNGRARLRAVHKGTQVWRTGSRRGACGVWERAGAGAGGRAPACASGLAGESAVHGDLRRLAERERFGAPAGAGGDAGLQEFQALEEAGDLLGGARSVGNGAAVRVEAADGLYVVGSVVLPSLSAR